LNHGRGQINQKLRKPDLVSIKDVPPIEDEGQYDRDKKSRLRQHTADTALNTLSVKTKAE
jgi:hypothetical protein